MEDNTNINSQQLLEKKHFLNNLMSHEAPLFRKTDGDDIHYYIIPKNKLLPVFDITYNARTEIMRVVSYKNKVRCTFRFPEKYLDTSIKEISLFNILNGLIEFEIEVNDSITIYFLEDFECYFSHFNLHKNEDLLNTFLDIRFAALQLQSLYYR